MRTIILVILMIGSAEAKVARKPAAFDQKSACGAVVAAKTTDELKAALLMLSMRQNELLHSPKDRHEVGTSLNHCWAEKTSKALVISFAGTGAYDPRTDHLLTFAMGCFDAEKRLNPKFNENFYYLVKQALKAKGKKADKWSAIDQGILPLFLTDESLAKSVNHFNFVSFPSEESEIIANPENITLDQIAELGAEIKASTSGFPKGIVNAMVCTKTYLQKAKALQIKPKVVVLSHSSGGRTAVKFLEAMKTQGFEADLVFSIDPVIEAHEALKEVADQYAGQLFSKKKKPVRVWSRDHGDRLYKPTNAKEWVSVYQTEDTYGIGVKQAPFGIHGSRVKNADQNIYLQNFKVDSATHEIKAHGGIGYRDETQALFLHEMHELFGK